MIDRLGGTDSDSAGASNTVATKRRHCNAGKPVTALKQGQLDAFTLKVSLHRLAPARTLHIFIDNDRTGDR